MLESSDPTLLKKRKNLSLDKEKSHVPNFTLHLPLCPPLLSLPTSLPPQLPLPPAMCVCSGACMYGPACGGRRSLTGVFLKFSPFEPRTHQLS